MFCKIGFDKLPKSKKVRRHDHLVKPVYAKEKVASLTKYTCTSDDYIRFSCLSCNFLVTQKHIDSPMLFHNFSGYNSSQGCQGPAIPANSCKFLQFLQIPDIPANSCTNSCKFLHFSLVAGISTYITSIYIVIVIYKTI